MAVRTDPDVVLLDVRMPGRSGIETCAEIKAAMPSVRIVMLTASDEESDLYEAVKTGASGYLLKDALDRRGGRRRSGWSPTGSR